MGRKTSTTDPDRHLSARDGIYYYKRRVPKALLELDERGPILRISLATRDLAQARLARDAYELADNEIWASFLNGSDKMAAKQKYASAVARAEALGLTYRTAADILKQEDGFEIIKRLRLLIDEKPGSMVEAAVLGGVERPKVSVTEAFDIYVSEIVADEVLSKSPKQRAHWKNIKKRAIDNFVELVSDKPVEEVTRADALRFYNLWQGRIAPKAGKATHSASTGNRDLGNMRVLLQRYMHYVGIDGYRNPFDGLSFSEKVARSRPPFPTEWISQKIMAPKALSTLNDQARAIVLIMIETGARPSEICNLAPDQIRLDADIPHILIRPRDDPDDPREIKTLSSVRSLPLVGVALAAIQRHPAGFPRYKDKGDSMSATLNKHFKTNKLFPTPKHKIYSLRHSFEDRMKVAGLDTELRMMIMGHAIERPRYGKGGSLEWYRDELLKIALPFDPAIV